MAQSGAGDHRAALESVGNVATIADHLKSDDLVLTKANIKSVEPTEPHGQQGFLIKLAGPVQVTYSPQGEQPHTVAMSEVAVQLGDITTDGKAALIAPGDVLVKAGWNYNLLHSDGSGGIHNPAFTLNVANATIAALKTK